MITSSRARRSRTAPEHAAERVVRHRCDRPRHGAGPSARRRRCRTESHSRVLPIESTSVSEVAAQHSWRHIARRIAEPTVRGADAVLISSAAEEPHDQGYGGVGGKKHVVSQAHRRPRGRRGVSASARISARSHNHQVDALDCLDSSSASIRASVASSTAYSASSIAAYA